MAKSQTQEFQVNTARDALALLSRSIYQKFGEEALPLINDVCHKLGVAVGEHMKEEMSAPGLIATAEVFIAGARKRGSPIEVEVIEISDKKVHIKGYRCGLGLANTDRKLCEAMMAMDKAIFETASGSKVKLDIAKTLAAGDLYCETIYTIVK